MSTLDEDFRECPRCGEPMEIADRFTDYWVCYECGAQVPFEEDAE